MIHQSFAPIFRRQIDANKASNEATRDPAI